MFLKSKDDVCLIIDKVDSAISSNPAFEKFLKESVFPFISDEYSFIADIFDEGKRIVLTSPFVMNEPMNKNSGNVFIQSCGFGMIEIGLNSKKELVMVYSLGSLFDADLWYENLFPFHQRKPFCGEALAHIEYYYKTYSTKGIENTCTVYQRRLHPVEVSNSQKEGLLLDLTKCGFQSIKNWREDGLPWPISFPETGSIFVGKRLVDYPIFSYVGEYSVKSGDYKIENINNYLNTSCLSEIGNVCLNSSNCFAQYKSDNCILIKGKVLTDAGIKKLLENKQLNYPLFVYPYKNLIPDSVYDSFIDVLDDATMKIVNHKNGSIDLKTLILR